MAQQLTHLPLPWTAAPSLLDFGVDQTAGFGGSGAQGRSVRLGSRWAVSFSALPALGYACAQQLIAARLAAHAAGSTVITSWPQPAFGSAIGSPVIDGAQGGNTINLRGLIAGASLPTGLFFSFQIAGRNYLYMTTAAGVATGAGKLTVAIAPWHRATPTDGAAVSFAAPQVEGFITPAGVTWDLERLAWVGLPAFTITEVA